jgi:hypothetical protein
MMSFAVAYTKLIGVVFTLIAATMLVVPAQNLQQDGVAFDTFPVAGKAEVRAYYCGTAAVVSYVCFCCELSVAMRAIQIVLGGFWSARVVGYCVDGIDTNPDLRFHQHLVFSLEVLGCAIATCFLTVLGTAMKDGVKRL